MWEEIVDSRPRMYIYEEYKRSFMAATPLRRWLPGMTVKTIG